MDLNINILDIFKAMFNIVKVIVVTAPWYAWLVLIAFLGAKLMQGRMKKTHKKDAGD